MWDWTYTGHMLVIPDGNILACRLFLAIGSCLLKCISVSQRREDYSVLNTEKNQRWTDIGLSSVQQATKFRWEFHVSLSLQAYLHARIICLQGISAPYPERYLNGHCRNIKKLQVILLEFPIPDTAHSQHIILSLWRSTEKSCFLMAIRWKQNIRKKKGKIGWMNECLELSYGHST